MYWKGDCVGQGTVELMVKKGIVDGVVEVKQVNSRVITMDIVLNEKSLCIIFVYCPQ